MSSEVSRRTLFQAAGVAGVAAALPASAAAQKPDVAPAAHGTEEDGVLFFLNDREAAFLRAAVDRLIPPDENWPGAADAGVVTYIDRQLAGSYGAGAKMYLEGPWVPDAPTVQGYQLRFTPAELYRVALAEIGEALRATHGGKLFEELDPHQQDDVLKALESGDLDLPSIPSPVFFETLLANTIEGFFADPAYGGNRNMAGWRMVGFPGAFAQYIDLVEQHGRAFTRPPVSIADSGARHPKLSDKMKME